MALQWPWPGLRSECRCAPTTRWWRLVRRSSNLRKADVSSSDSATPFPSSRPARAVNPLLDARDLRLPRIADPCVLVMFGITGDLAGWFLQKAELWMLAALCACQWGGLL